jgi:hypothetical protein
MTLNQQLAEMDYLLVGLRSTTDSYEILSIKTEIHAKMIRWNLIDPAEFGTTQAEIDL